jgi:flagellar basal-body rod protein FlgB
MLDKLTSTLDFQGNALALRAERQRIIASNIANVDTPGYAARDFNFKAAMSQAMAQQSGLGAAPALQTSMATTDPRHLSMSMSDSSLGNTVEYATPTQPAMDNNTVDLDRERAAFADNAIRYEAALRFINGHSKTILSAIQGQ